MNRLHPQLVTIAALVAGCLSACEGPGTSAQEKMNKAQSEADKAGADAHAEADKKGNSAQADADEKIAEARADFAKVREDHRHGVQADLVGLDKTIAELDAKSKTATGSARTNLAAKVADVHLRRDAFAAELRRLEDSTATTWDAGKKRLDESWTELKAAVDGA